MDRLINKVYLSGVSFARARYPVAYNNVSSYAIETIGY